MSRFLENIRPRSWYYALSTVLMMLFPLICRYCGDGNLPPQKAFARFWINLIFLNLLLAYGLFFIGKNKAVVVSRSEWILFIVVGIFLCALPPIFSGDLHDYLMRGRILGVYHENPYRVPRDYPHDLFYSLSTWVRVYQLPENYGPVWSSVQWIAPTLFRDSYFGSLFFFKLILFGFLAGCVFIFSRICRLVAPEHAVWMVPLFALNPNLIDHILVDGHNEIVMVFWIIAALYLSLKNKYFWTVIAATLAVLVKFTPVILLPAFGIYAFRSQTAQSPRALIKLVLKTVVIFVVVGVIFYWPFWMGPSTLSYFSKFSDWFYSNSVPYAIHRLIGRLGVALPEIAVKHFFMVFFGLNCLWALAWLWLQKKQDARSLCRAVTWMFMAMYISYAIPFYGHHLLWMLPFLILAQFPAPFLCLILFAATGVFFYFKRMSVLFMISLAVYVFYVLILNFRARNALKDSGTGRENQL